MNLYISEAGPRDAPSIVFLHALGLSSAMWQPQFEQLADKYHCIAPDLPGHGKSSAIDTVGLEECGKEIADLIRHSTPEGRAHVVGISLGAAIVLTMLRTAPETIDTAIVSSPSAHLDWILSTVNRRNEALLRVLKPDQLADLLYRQYHIPQQYRALLSEDVEELRPEVLMQGNSLFATMQPPKKVQLPLLVVVGQMEPVPAREKVQAISAAIDGAKGLIAPGSRHIWSLESPLLFTNMVQSWVTKQPMPAALRVV